jgi:hypothetical protein
MQKALASKCHARKRREGGRTRRTERLFRALRAVADFPEGVGYLPEDASGARLG